MYSANFSKLPIVASILLFCDLVLAQENAVAAQAAEGQQYDFLIGSWDCTYIQYTNKKPNTGEVAAEYPCDWHARYTFDGLMVQDDFRMFYRERVVFSGTTLRTWVPAKNRWDLAFLGSGIGHWPNFHGTWQKPNMEISASGVDQGGEFISKIRFKDIQAESFLWEMEKSYDAGKTWQLDAQIKTKRQTQ